MRSCSQKPAATHSREEKRDFSLRKPTGSQEVNRKNESVGLLRSK